MRIEHSISVDFQRPGVRPVIRIVEGDAAARFVVVNLYSGGEPYSVGAGVTGVVKYAKSDGHSGVYDTLDPGSDTERAACVFHDNSRQAVIELAPNISMGFGLVAMMIQFVGAGGDNILGTFPVDIIVERDPTDGTEAEDYFSLRALDELYQAIDNAEADAAAALAASMKNITAEYNAAVATRPALTPDEFFMEQSDGMYRIDALDSDNPHIARVVIDRLGGIHANITEWIQSERHERIYIDSTLVTTIAMDTRDGHATINPASLMAAIGRAVETAETVLLLEFDVRNLKAAAEGRIYRVETDATTADLKTMPPSGVLPGALVSAAGSAARQLIVYGKNRCSIDKSLWVTGTYFELPLDLEPGTYTISLEKNLMNPTDAPLPGTYLTFLSPSGLTSGWTAGRLIGRTTDNYSAQTPYTFTVDAANHKSLYFYFNKNGGTLPDNYADIISAFFGTIQVERGSSATTIVPARRDVIQIPSGGIPADGIQIAAENNGAVRVVHSGSAAVASTINYYIQL